MKSIERLAAEHFNQYANNITPGANWKYLDKIRQYEWMVETAELMMMCLNTLEKDIELKKRLEGSNSFEKGFVLGEVQENKRLINHIKTLKDSVSDQIEAFKELI